MGHLTCDGGGMGRGTQAIRIYEAGITGTTETVEEQGPS